jgi:RNA polymerase sigma-70 factor (ECF subfamily)
MKAATTQACSPATKEYSDDRFDQQDPGLRLRQLRLRDGLPLQRGPVQLRMRVATEPAERDPDAPGVLGVLLENHARFLGFLERRLGSRDDAEDILQEAFVRSIGRTDALESAESATAWFYRVLRNAIIDHHRRQSTRDRALVGLAAEEQQEVPGSDQELDAVACACVMSLVDTLKPEYGTALRRVDLDGLSVRGFAEEAGITPSNAGVRLHRARAALKRQLARACGTCLEHGCLDCRCGGTAGDGVSSRDREPQ